MLVNFLSSINDISPEEWDGLWQTDYPFVQHRFLKILEDTHCTTRESGWEPYHFVLRDDGKLVAAMLLFKKHHSYGEYVFDWGWADAYHRTGLDYYPKLLSAVPFTPATGPRLALSKDLSEDKKQSVIASVVQSLCEHVNEKEMSSFHLLFPQSENRKWMIEGGLVERQGCQFHWFNQGYKSFDEFLSTFNSRKRKSVRKERQKVSSGNIQLKMRPAGDLNDNDWKIFFALYHRTYLKRSGRPGYLTEGFFTSLGKAFPDQVLLCFAYLNDEILAAALYFRDSQTLYGRYWGAREEYDGLHFEACYYQGIEYAISEGLSRFDPGAQGEHKIQRGFVPVKTSSFHWLAHAGFHKAVEEFVREELHHNQAYIEDGNRYLPFKEGVEPAPCDCLI